MLCYGVVWVVCNAKEPLFMLWSGIGRVTGAHQQQQLVSSTASGALQALSSGICIQKIGMSVAALRQCGGGAVAAGWQAIHRTVYRLWVRRWPWRAFQRVFCVLGACAVASQRGVAS